MKQRRELSISEWQAAPFSFINNRLLLGVGTHEPDVAAHRGMNVMTISWGMFGTVWNRPMIQVMVRPQRYSFGLLESGDSFTLSHFEPEFVKVLQVCGSVSGRNQDKISSCGLSAIPSLKVAAPSFAESHLSFECRIVYRDRLKPNGFAADYISPLYQDDWHYLYWGEVLTITAKDA